MPTKKAAQTTEAEEEPEAEEEAADPDYRFAGLAQPAPSDPLHPDHVEWMHEHAGGPSPDELTDIKAEQAKAEEAEAEAVATRAEAEAEPEPE